MPTPALPSHGLPEPQPAEPRRYLKRITGYLILWLGLGPWKHLRVAFVRMLSQPLSWTGFGQRPQLSPCGPSLQKVYSTFHF